MVILYVRLVSFVCLQMRVFGAVTNQTNDNGKVEKGLTRRLVSTDVLVHVLLNKIGWFLQGRSLASWQLLVERNKLHHSLGVGVGANVLLLVSN